MKRLLGLGTLALVLTAGAAYAQEPAGEPKEATHESGPAHEEEAPESPLYTVAKWVNLAILLGGLGYLLKKPAMEFFEGRKQEIATGLERAKAAQEDAAKRMSEIEQRLSRLSAEIAQLQRQADQEADAEKAKIVAEAQKEVERVVEQSRQEMERIAHGIQREIKASVADGVIERAGQKLQTRMTQDDQKRVVVRFIKNL